MRVHDIERVYFLSFTVYYVFGRSIYGTVIRSHETLLYIAVGKPRLHFYATQHKVDARAKVSRPCVDLLLPMGIHTLAVGVKFPADIPEHRMLSTWIALANDLAVLEKLVEKAPVGAVEIILLRDTLLIHVFFCLCGIDLFSRYIEISRQYDPLAHLRKVADAGVESRNKTIPEVVSEAVAIGWTVHTEEDKGGELKNQAAALRVQRCCVDA